MNLEEIFVDYEDKSRPIVIIDSGKGGLHILKELKEKFPVENFLMIYDNEFAPYGNKNTKILRQRMGKLIRKLKKVNPKSIILGCNTVDAISGEDFNSYFPHIPVYNIISITAAATMKKNNKNSVVMGTKNTIESQKYIYYMLERKNMHLYGLECLDLAKAIEDDEKINEVLSTELKPLEGLEFDSLILGCTHYYFVKERIAKKFKNIDIIDSSEELIKYFIESFPEVLYNRAEKQKIFISLTNEDELIEENIKNYLNVDLKFIPLSL